MGFQVKKAVREKIFVKIALMAPQGGGKTFSSLRLATGMANEIEKQTGERPKILLGNTEQKRGYYYANEFDYDIVDVDAPHNPEKYVELIDFAVESGYGILIIDSASHEWSGPGGCLELQTKAGGTYQAWGKVTPRHNRFIEAIADSPIHIIATMRAEDQYEVEKSESGKTSVKKIGKGAQQRKGFEYDFSCSFLLDQKTNMAEPQKDNTHLFENESNVLLNEHYGEKIIQWANSGKEYTPVSRGKNESSETVESVVSEIATEFKSKIASGVDKNIVYEKINEVCGTKNFMTIKDVEKAKEVLEAVKKF